jgi:mono/diheme cytochrome c family protein
VRLAIFLSLAGSLLAQNPNQGPGANAALKSGEKIFRMSCAVGYCHGEGGKANRGPRLAGRGFASDYVDRVVRKGIPNTAMPAFEGRLKDPDLEAVIAYTVNLSGGSSATSTSDTHSTATPQPIAPPAVPAAHVRGRELFFDANRMVRCGTCHLSQEHGRNVAEMQKGQVQTAVLADGERFPALVQPEVGGLVRAYDLTGPMPVLRTFPKAQVKAIEPNANWDHAKAMGTYSAAEMQAIRGYLDWASKARR